jgi:hypothetical protein
MTRTRSINRYLLLLAPALLIAAAPGCGKFRRGAGVPPAVLVFTNESLDQADVFVVGSGLPARRIGTVMAGRTETLKVPPDLATRGNLNIVARLLARSIRPQTGFVPIAPGEQYEVRLPPDERLLVFLPSRG